MVGRRDGVAERLVVAAGLSLETLDVSGVHAGTPGGIARAASQLTRATLEARRLVRRMRPDVVVGSGGYVSVPVVVAALAQQIPVVLLEQNAVPGRATRLLARRARAVAASFAETARYLPHARVVHTGNPIRAEVLAVTPRPIGDRLRSILVTGGSQGARRLNRAVTGSMVKLLRTTRSSASSISAAASITRRSPPPPRPCRPRSPPGTPRVRSSTTWRRAWPRAISWSCARAGPRSPSAPCSAAR